MLILMEWKILERKRWREREPRITTNKRFMKKEFLQMEYIFYTHTIIADKALSGFPMFQYKMVNNNYKSESRKCPKNFNNVTITHSFRNQK